jgi:hypothetical protein
MTAAGGSASAAAPAAGEHNSENQGGGGPAPSFDGSKEQSFQVWKRKIQLWKIATVGIGDGPAEEKMKRKLASKVAGRLGGRAQELALNMEDDELTATDGLEQLIAKLDKVYGETDVQRSFKTLKQLLALVWTTGTDIEDFLAQFELLYNKTSQGSQGVKLSSTVQAMLVLMCAKLSSEEELAVMSNCREPLDYTDVRNTMNRLFKDSRKKGKTAYVADGQWDAWMGSPITDTDGSVVGYNLEGDFYMMGTEGGDDAGDWPDAMWVKGKKFVRNGGKGKGKGGSKGKDGKKGGGPKGPQDMSKVKCYGCGEKGHFARDCTKKPKEGNVTFTVGDGQPSAK